VTVHRHGPVLAYRLGVVTPGEVEDNDIIAAPHTVATRAATAGNLRVPRVHRRAGGGPTFLLDVADGPLSWPDERPETGWHVTAWRPVPRRHHPWQPPLGTSTERSTSRAHR
jgi:hypothetical protein